MRTRRTILQTAWIGLLLLLPACGGAIEPTPAAEIITFSAERTELQAGECTILHWQVTEGFGVVLNGEEVARAGELEVCPPESRVFELSVDLGDRVETRAVEILVAGQPAGPGEDASPPAGEPGVWQRLGGPPGGLGYDIRYNFDDPNVWYVTDTGAGVHISADNGLTWQPSNTGIEAQATFAGSNDYPQIFSLTVDPHDPQIVWVGTQDSGRVYRSTDGGQTWIRRDNGITLEYDLLSFRGFTVDPRSSDIVYAMGETTIENVDDPAGLRQQVGGVIYKTTDGGENWEQFWSGGVHSSLTRYMWIDPEDPDAMYVSTGIFDRYAAGGRLPQVFAWEGGLGVLKSTDGGRTWRALGQENGLRMLYIGSLYMHPEDPDVLLAAAGHLIDGSLLDEWTALGEPISAGVYRTADGGEHWTQTLVPDEWQAFTAVELCPSDPDIGYAGSEKSFYLTEDAGRTWELVSGGDRMWGPPGIEAGWPIDLQCDPRDPGRVFANNYNGGNFLSEDYGRTWVNASDGYSGAIVFRAEVDPSDPSRVYAAGRSGPWRSDDGGVTWAGIYYPPPGASVRGIEWTFAAVDPSQPGHILGGHAPLLESFDGGDSWQLRWQGDGSQGTVSAAVFAPSNPQVVYAGLAGDGCIRFHESIPCDIGGGVLASQDGGATWQSASGGALGEAPVYDMAVDQSDAHRAYAAAETGLFRTTDGGASWQLLPILPEVVRVRSVAIDPSDSRRLLAGVDRRAIYISDDGGQTWRAAASGLEPNGSIHEIVFDPVHPSTVYMSDVLNGVYRSTDGGLTWEIQNTGLSNRAVLGLSISSDGQHLYAATHGGGVFRMDLDGQALLLTSVVPPNRE
jgi:photosystem II stability/assembly factor-like uncharacterized protein